MDKNLRFIKEKHIQRTMENLIKNRMMAFYCETREQALNQISELLKEGDTVAAGGSMSLFEAGVIDHLRKGRYNFIDRYAEGLSKEEIHEAYRKSFFADVYLTSTNAVTEEGELYNVDGMGNRVAAMIYGPKSVIVLAGINKLVKDIDEAAERVRRVAAPANAVRLGMETPCAKAGFCMKCRSEDRICCSYTVFGQQRVKDRIKVILVGENLGY